MVCSSCGSGLPKEAKACPNCGTLTPAYHSHYGTFPNEPTAMSNSTSMPTVSAKLSSASSSPLAKPVTSYGTNPYGDLPDNPYSTKLTPPPPPTKRVSSPSRRGKRNLPLFVGLGLLVVILAGSGIFAVLHAIAGSGGNGTGDKPAPNLNKTAAQALYNRTTASTPVLDDSLAGPDNYGWDNTAGQNTSCQFTAGAYHAKTVPGFFAPCYAKATNFSNFLYQAQITVLNGHSGGLVFRANSKNDSAYLFRMSTDGTYILNKYYPDSAGKVQGETVFSGTSNTILKGNNQPNIIAVLAQGENLYVFINKQFVDKATDATYKDGQIGVYVDSDANPVEAAFSKAQVWKL